ncbi:uncharacterized protein [Henckelia pumila]|uniref:uncharacterized protein n=1 Tax=Henckelia pumila TaxID=405737 RepID=UPI003C6E6FD1
MRDDDVPVPKPRSQWTADENTAAIYNAKALNAMFTSVDMNLFNLIGTCTCARDAWEKLQTHCEGSASVKKTRMRLITSKFEIMRMEESETIMEYNGRLKSLANEASILGDPISNERLVSKVLRSVPKRFHTKVCAIDESKDTSIMGLDELISSLCTYEMELEAEDDSKVQQEVNDSDLEKNSIALISKKFTDYLKVMKEKKDVKSAQPSKFPRLPMSEKPQKPAATRGPRQRYEGNVRDMDTTLMNAQIAFGKINPLGVGSGVATPGRNTVQKSVCFVASNLDNSSNHEEQVADPYTLEVFVKEGNDSLNHPSTALKGLKDHLTDYIEQNGGRVTYGGGAKGRIVGKGTLNVEGTRSVDNCYQLGEELACRHSKVDEFSLWHQKLGHVNFKTLKNLSKYEAVRGLPNLKTGVPYVCGACQKDLKGKIAEDDTESSLEISFEEHSVVPDVATPNTTLVPP